MHYCSLSARHGCLCLQALCTPEVHLAEHENMSCSSHFIVSAYPFLFFILLFMKWCYTCITLCTLFYFFFDMSQETFTHCSHVAIKINIIIYAIFILICNSLSKNEFRIYTWSITKTASFYLKALNGP